MHFKGLSLVCEIGGKSLGSIFFLFKKKKNTFIQGGCIKLIKRNSKDIYNVTYDFYFL